MGYQAFVDRFGTTLGGRYLIGVLARVDRVLFRLTKGRVTTGAGTRYGEFVMMLTCRGARTGLDREVPLLCTPHEDALIVVASQGGRETHPAWYYNVKANPRVRVTFHGVIQERIAREVVGEERERLWRIAASNYPGYEVYRSRVKRAIPVIVLAAGQP